jgi:hypothetical protein
VTKGEVVRGDKVDRMMFGNIDVLFVLLRFQK